LGYRFGVAVATEALRLFCGAELFRVSHPFVTGTFTIARYIRCSTGRLAFIAIRVAIFATNGIKYLHEACGNITAQHTTEDSPKVPDGFGHRD
jgi:hypothetical protein